MDFFRQPIVIYAAFFLIATLFSIGVNQLLLRWLKNLGNNRRSNGQENLVRWAAQTKPAIGGISFLILFLLSICSYFILPFGTEAKFSKALFALLGSSMVGFTIGLIDDSYNTPPRFKLIGQLTCAAIMVSMGIVIPISDLFLLNAALTTFWVVGIMNAINLLDNMDGVTAGISAVICISLLMAIYMLGGFTGFYTIVTLGVLASLIGFLFFNWHPSKMYMGDTGSQFLGAFLAFLSVVWLWKLPAGTSLSIERFLLPALVFLLPLIDTTTVTIRRIARGSSPFVGGRDHTTHHLAYCGLKDRQVAGVFVGLSLALLPLSYWVCNSLLKNNWSWGKSLIVIAVLVSIFIAAQWMYEVGKKKSKSKS